MGYMIKNEFPYDVHENKKSMREFWTILTLLIVRKREFVGIKNGSIPWAETGNRRTKESDLWKSDIGISI
jgi:hypothetical protein